MSITLVAGIPGGDHGLSGLYSKSDRDSTEYRIMFAFVQVVRLSVMLLEVDGGFVSILILLTS